MSQYDPAKLRNLRDNIDAYLKRGNQEDLRIYDALEESIGKAVADSMKPLLEDFKQYLDDKLEKPAIGSEPKPQDWHPSVACGKTTKRDNLTAGTREGFLLLEGRWEPTK